MEKQFAAFGFFIDNNGGRYRLDGPIGHATWKEIPADGSLKPIRIAIENVLKEIAERMVREEDGIAEVEEETTAKPDAAAQAVHRGMNFGVKLANDFRFGAAEFIGQDDEG